MPRVALIGFFWILAVVALGSCQCGPGVSDGSPTADDGAGEDDGGPGQSDAGRCPMGCEGGQFCSAAGNCLAAGACDLNADCVEGMLCDLMERVCKPGSECGSQEITGGVVTPNLLIDLDRSCSMRNNVSGTPKWTIAVNAINQLTTTFQDQIRFGLTLFPDTVGGNCGQGAIPISPNDGNEASIRALLSASLDAGDPNYPDGPCVTNIDTAMLQAQNEPALYDPERVSYVLLITDGQQSGCNNAGGDDGTTSIIGDLNDAGISTFVVGFGSGIDPAQMNTFAQAGGVPASGDAGYYKAEDQLSLESVLATIGLRTLGCSYSLSDVPADPSRLFVFFDDSEPVTRDPSHADGWDYDATSNRVTIYGPSCDRLNSGAVLDLDIVFGCPVVRIE